MNKSTKLIKKLSKEVMNDNFYYCKVGRVITKWEAIENNFEGTNNIFAHYICLYLRILDVTIILLSFCHSNKRYKKQLNKKGNSNLFSSKGNLISIIEYIYALC